LAPFRTGFPTMTEFQLLMLFGVLLFSGCTAAIAVLADS
jgi:hypothetical protein